MIVTAINICLHDKVCVSCILEHMFVNKLIAAEQIKVFKGTDVYVMIMSTMSCKMQLIEKVRTEAQTFVWVQRPFPWEEWVSGSAETPKI